MNNVPQAPAFKVGDIVLIAAPGQEFLPLDTPLEIKALPGGPDGYGGVVEDYTVWNEDKTDFWYVGTKLLRPAPAPLADGTYTFTLTPRIGAGIEITATVQNGIVIEWLRNGLPALQTEFQRVDFTGALAREVAERNRLRGLLRPVEFTPAPLVAHNPVTGAVGLPVRVGEGAA